MGVEARSVPGSESADLPSWYRRFDLSWYQDWTGVLQPHRHNWSDFTLIQISAEAEWHMGTAEFILALLGVHVRLTWYWPNENRVQLVDMCEAFKRGELETVPLDEVISRGDEASGVTK